MVSRYSAPRRRQHAPDDVSRAAARAARARQRHLAKASALYAELVATVAELRQQTPPWSAQEIADLIGVSKQRAQQMIGEARDAGLLDEGDATG